MFKSGIKNQLFAALCVNLATFTTGGAFGWTSSSLIILQSDLSPLQSGPISLEDSSWIAAMMCIGGLIGNIFYGWTSDFGRKIPIISIAIPQLVGWLLLIFATNPIYLYMFRFFLGFSAGGAIALIPVFVAEISDHKIRGILGTFFPLSFNLGILMSFVLSNYARYELIPIVYMVPPILFFIGFIFCPDTPPFLKRQRKDPEVEKSLRFYNNIRRESFQRLELVKAEMNKSKSNNKIDVLNKGSTRFTLNDFTAPAARKALLISLMLALLNQLCGIFALLNYTASIFAEAGSELSPNNSAIVIGLIQLVGSYVTSILVERSGRKMLLSSSAACTGIGLTCLGIYSLLKSYDRDLSSLEWIPLVCFSFSIFSASWGVLSLPPIVTAEILPDKIRVFGASLCSSFSWGLGFLCTKYYPIISTVYGMHICLFIFAGFSFIGALFVILVMPETRGKRLEHIMDMLQN